MAKMIFIALRRAQGEREINFFRFPLVSFWMSKVIFIVLRQAQDERGNSLILFMVSLPFLFVMNSSKPFVVSLSNHENPLWVDVYVCLYPACLQFVHKDMDECEPANFFVITTHVGAMGDIPSIHGHNRSGGII